MAKNIGTMIRSYEPMIRLVAFMILLVMVISILVDTDFDSSILEPQGQAEEVVQEEQESK